MIFLLAQFFGFQSALYQGRHRRRILAEVGREHNSLAATGVATLATDWKIRDEIKRSSKINARLAETSTYTAGALPSAARGVGAASSARPIPSRERRLV